MTALQGAIRQPRVSRFWLWCGLVAASLTWVLGFTTSAFAVSGASDGRAGAENVPPNLSRFSDNIGATEETGETFLCPGVQFDPPIFGSTVWYKFTPPGFGTATFRAVESTEVLGDADGFYGDDDGFFDPIMVVYRGALYSESVQLGCNDDEPGGAGEVVYSSGVSLFVDPRLVYAIQVGGAWYDGDDVNGNPIEGPEEGSFTYSVGFQPAPLIEAELIRKWLPYNIRRGRLHNQTRIKKFKLITEPGSTVVIKCRRDCRGIKRVTGDPLLLSDDTLNLKRLFRRNRLLKAGTKIKLSLTKPGEIGRIYRFRIRAADSPKARLCQLQPSGEVTKCRSLS